MASKRNSKATEKPDTAIPRFVIDLSLNPEDRYVALAKQYRPQIQKLTSLFDELLSDLDIPEGFHKSINRVARLLLRKVHSPIETAELRGISKTAGIPMYLLVSLNVILDLLMGCTSGAVRSVSDGQNPEEARMLHFRTLDWGMDPLRSVIVQLDYIESKKDAAQVLGSSITYVGFVGVLTGVRKYFSVSLNFRAMHDGASKAQHFRFYFHHLLVLLGLRQSISSLLRSCLFHSLIPGPEWVEFPVMLDFLTEKVPSKHTTSAYLICCNGRQCVSLEKDFATAVIRQSESFIVTTNHDLGQKASQQNDPSPKKHAAAMRELIEESVDRRDCIVGKWNAKVRKERRRLQSSSNSTAYGTPTERRHTRSMRSTQEVLIDNENGNGNGNENENENGGEPQSLTAGRSDVDTSKVEDTMTVTERELVRWTTAFPTTNECTHFAAILDPWNGRILWSQRYLRPVEVPSDEAPRVELEEYLDVE